MGLVDFFRRAGWQLLAGEERAREKIEAFESLLALDRTAHDRLAELEDFFHGASPVDLAVVYDTYAELADSIQSASKALNRIVENRHAALEEVLSRVDGYARFFIAPKRPAGGPPYVVTLEEAGSHETDAIGGKAKTLYQLESRFGFRIPAGFVITAAAWRRFVEANRLQESIDAELKQIRLDDAASLGQAAEALQAMVKKGDVPEEVAAEIGQALKRLQSKIGSSAAIALRSSAVGEDGTASFAGQYRSVLNADPENIFDDYRRVIAGKYSPQALFYRIHQGLWDTETPMAVLVMEMVDARTAGVVYTRDPRKEADPSIRIHASPGPGERVVGGQASPDLFVFSAEDPPHLRRRRLRSENDPALEPQAAERLARMALRIEKAFNGPQDIEWCLDNDNRLVFLQARPLRIPRHREETARDCRFEDVKNRVLVQGGETASPGIGAGPAHRVEHVGDLQRLPEGAVLVAPSALPELASVMSRVRAVVTDKGSSAGHLATVAREFGVPALVDTGDGSARLTPGTEVTVHADGKKVFEGLVTEMIESPCAEGLTPEDTPFWRRMSGLMSFVSPLELVDPEAANFTPEGCRSFHDMLRFVHEKAVEAMFSLTDRKLKAFSGARKLRPGIPMLFYVLDVGGGLKPSGTERGELGESDVTCKPLLSLLRGLKHPDIQWGPFHHFDWKAHDKTAMGGTNADPDAAIYASHAIISEIRMNLNLKFGYHFVLLDARAPTDGDTGHLLFRFSGGGADMAQRRHRALFLNRILRRIGFSVRQKSDLVDASWPNMADAREMDRTLDVVGRLLGATRLMDMRLKDRQSVDIAVSAFFAGRYDFSNNS